jgi:DNA-binding CsgD family transcriptional regulator
MDAWFGGDFERCLDLCGAVRLRDANTETHVALLRARALVRLHRLDEALGVLSHVRTGSDQPDETATALMLTGEAHVRRGDAQSGLGFLLSAQGKASRAHATIRSEISLNIGLAHYCRHDFAAADNSLRLVSDDADLVHARAIQYRAWVASARGDTQRAAALFVQALEALDACRHHDRYFEANCVRALAHIGVERLDRRVWEFVSARRARIDWTSGALAEPRFFIAYCAAAYQMDVEGDPGGAAREARHAEQIAPTEAFRVEARCKRASLARQSGEVLSHQDHVESAAELFASLDPAGLTGDEKVVPLVLAEELASSRPSDARALVSLYGQLSPLSPMRLMTQSPMGAAYRLLVEARVHECSADMNAALLRYRHAFELFDRIGYSRRATMVALRIWRLSGDRKAYAYAVNATAHLSPQSWILREVEAAKTQRVRLTAVQREVLSLICQGKSNPEIARLRKRSLHTVRNLVARLFEIFEVSSREELAVQCVRRGLYTPT